MLLEHLIEVELRFDVAGWHVFEEVAHVFRNVVAVLLLVAVVVGRFSGRIDFLFGALDFRASQSELRGAFQFLHCRLHSLHVLSWFRQYDERKCPHRFAHDVVAVFNHCCCKRTVGLLREFSQTCVDNAGNDT